MIPVFYADLSCEQSKVSLIGLACEAAALIDDIVCDDTSAEVEVVGFDLYGSVGSVNNALEVYIC